MVMVLSNKKRTRMTLKEKLKVIKEDEIPYYKWCYGKFFLVGYVEKD